LLGEVVKRVAQDLDRQVVEQDLGNPFLSSHNYRPYPLNVQYFTPIRGVGTARRFAFVDGGNQELIGAPNFSVQLNRAYFNIFAGTKMTQAQSLPNKIEFISITHADFRKEQIYFHTSMFPLNEKFAAFIPDSSDLSLNSVDRRIMVGHARADIGRIASIARRFAEWKYANHIVDAELHEKDLLVMDGTLWTAFPNESKYARAVYEVASEKGVLATGLSKTSRLFTTTGLSLLGAIRRLALDNEVGPTWYYYPIADSLTPDHEAAIFLVKLSDQSQRIFRYEIHAKQAKSLGPEDLSEIFSGLSLNASDLSFPGYPYGLIDADDNARVRSEELETYRVLLLSEISKLGSAAKFVRHMESTDAHDALNSLKEASYA
jgi:hypothetical protein